jgi:acetolactate synthase-1/2/3 large subunit
MRSGGEILVQSLIALGATKSFGVPGESYLAVLDALHDSAGALDFVLCRNEGGAAFAAAAYGKLTGAPGICFVTRGPGATNASIGIHTAMQDSAPMLLFVGQVDSGVRGREAFQELDYKSVFGTIAKWAVEIDSVDRIPEIIARSWKTATAGRPGPVVVALPEDVLAARSYVSPLSDRIQLSEPAPTSVAFDQIKAFLAGASRPVLLVGGCNWSVDGRVALQRFAEESDIPVVTAFRYQDQFDNHSPSFVGEAGVGMSTHVSEVLKDADLIIAINVRFGEITTDGYVLLRVPTPTQTLIHVHASEAEICKVYIPRLGIISGPNAFAMGLSIVKGNWADWRREARNAYELSLKCPAQPSPVDMGEVAAWLRNNLPSDVVITNGAGNFTVWPNKFFKYGTDARLLAPQSGAMGYGLPAAIAAKVAFPKRLVVCFAGDGDFQMNCQELGTAMQLGAKLIILILNNGIYGTIRAHQERAYPGRVIGTTVKNPDFTALAKAYGYHAERVTRTSEFPDAFARSLASATGAVLDLDISPEALTPRQTLSDMRRMAFAAKRLGK